MSRYPLDRDDILEMAEEAFGDPEDGGDRLTEAEAELVEAAFPDEEEDSAGAYREGGKFSRSRRKRLREAQEEAEADDDFDARDVDESVHTSMFGGAL